MLVDTGRHSLQLQRQASLLQQPNPSQAAVIGARNRRQRFVRLPRAPVQRDLNGKRRPLRQVVRNLFGDDGAVGKQRDQESFFLGVGVDLKEVFTREDLAAGIKQPEAAHLDQFIEYTEVLFLAQLPLPGVHITHGQVVIAVQALQRTPTRHLDRNLQRHTLASLALMKIRTERAVTQLLQSPSILKAADALLTRPLPPVLPAPLVPQSPAIATAAGTSTRPTAFISPTNSSTSRSACAGSTSYSRATAEDSSATVFADSSNLQIREPVPLKL